MTAANKTDKKRHLFPLKLRMQLIVSYAVISFIIVSVIGSVSYVAILNVLKKQSEQLILQSFHQTEYNINSFLDEVDTLSKSMSVEPSVQNYLEFKEMADFTSVDIVRNLFGTLGNVLRDKNYLDAVFIFGEDENYLGLSRKSMWREQEGAPVSKYYHTSIYTDSLESFPRMAWIGGMSLGALVELTKEQQDTNCIMAARNIRRLYEGVPGATLVLCIREEKLNSIYTHLLNYPGSSICILDSTGQVISSNQSGKIGTSGHFPNAAFTKEKSGSFVQKRDGQSNQVTYLHMDKTNWIIVIEMPMGYLTNNADLIMQLILWAFLISLFLIILIYFFWITKITKPMSHLVRAMGEVEQGNIGANVQPVPNNEIGLVITQFNTMSASILDLMKQNKQMEQQKIQLEIANLQAQINPHFLYNTLNTIKWMGAVIRAGNIVECVTALGNLLKPIFSENKLMHTIGEEFTYLKNYITIMEYRYGNSIQFTIRAEEALLKCFTVRFILQPIIENSILHGFSNSGRSGTLQIEAQEYEEEIRFCIRDTGAGMPAKQLRLIQQALRQGYVPEDASAGRASIGLYNVNQRLRLHFGKSAVSDKGDIPAQDIPYGISIESEEGVGTQVFVRIPKIYENSADKS